MTTQNQSRFRGRFTALLTLAGVAIGLGNVWRFPYMMGQNGGSAFLLIYLGMMLLIAIPALAAEWALARHCRTGTLGAFEVVFGRSWGRAVGGLLVVGILIANSYYMVMIGNILYAAAFSVLAGFNPETAESYATGRDEFSFQYGFALVVLSWALWVIHRGINDGVEAVSRLFVPLFGVIMIYLVVNTLLLDGALDQLRVFLQPDFSLIGPRELFAAMGQACFSLGIGGTLMLVYGSYLSREETLLSKAVYTGLADVGAALLAALFIVPAVLVFGMSMASGPSLIFFTLPELFSIMPFGRLVGSLFLVALTLMGFLSAVAGLQVCLRGMEHLWRVRLGRGQMILILGAAQVMLMAPSALNPDLVGTLDLIFGSGFLVFGSAMAVIGLAWSMGSGVIADELGGESRARWLTPWLRWAVPASLLIVLVLYIYDSIQA